MNLNLTTFIETRLSEYRNFIIQAIHEQNRILTELGGEYLNLDNQGARIEAMRYVVQNIAKVRSRFMLDIIVGIIGHRADSLLNYGRGRRTESGTTKRLMHGAVKNGKPIGVVSSLRDS